MHDAKLTIERAQEIIARVNKHSAEHPPGEICQVEKKITLLRQLNWHTNSAWLHGYASACEHAANVYAALEGFQVAMGMLRPEYGQELSAALYVACEKWLASIGESPAEEGREFDSLVEIGEGA